MTTEFSRAVERFAQQAPEDAERITRAAIIQLWNSVITSTPVGNADLWKGDAPPGYVGGRLRGNWFATIGRASTETTDSTSRKGSAASSAALAVDRAPKGRDIQFWLTNNLPYAERVENGWSSQAPRGMVKKNVRRWTRIIKRAAR